VNTRTESIPTETCESIKLWIAAHAKWFYVVWQVTEFPFPPTRARLTDWPGKEGVQLTEFAFLPTRARLTEWPGKGMQFTNIAGHVVHDVLA
jgi:hypothetical protein